MNKSSVILKFVVLFGVGDFYKTFCSAMASRRGNDDDEEMEIDDNEEEGTVNPQN